MRKLWWVWVCAALSIGAATGAAPAQARPEPAATLRPVPPGFFGVVSQAPLTRADLSRMKGVVGTLRLPVSWRESEPSPGRFELATLDAEVAAAAARGIRVQAVVAGRPAWLGSDQARPPLGPRALSAWARFLRVLVERYGAGGEFWRGRARRLPIRVWQVWNEPNFRLFWHPRPSPGGYARLLRRSARAIRGADPRARIALAGVAPVGAGMKTWVFLRRLLRRPGVRSSFDFAALHPYSVTVPQLDYQVRRVRAAMRAVGVGRRPLLVTELGVASQGAYPSAFVLGPDGQAGFLEAAFARLLEMRRRWRIAGVDWYAWQDIPLSDPHCSFCQGAGLVEVSGRPKPAWFAFRHLAGAASRRGWPAR